MEKFCFADLIVEMDCQYPMLKDRSRKYLLPDSDKRKPDITVNLSEDDFLRYEKKIPDADREICEYMLAGECFYRRLLSFDGMLLHSSVVGFDGKAYIFSANCGVGKSTHTHLWTRYIKNTIIINDDKPAVRKINGEYYAYGTPFSGKNDENANVGYPVGALVFIERSKVNKIRKISPVEAVPLIYQQTTQPVASPKHMDILFGFLDGLLTSVPLYILSCDMSSEAVKTSFEALTGESFEKHLKETTNED
jgi:hypothetical protein